MRRPAQSTGPVSRLHVSLNTPGHDDLKEKGKDTFWPGRRTPKEKEEEEEQDEQEEEE